MFFESTIMPDQALFIGHSLVGPTMPVMFDAFTGAAWSADAQVINGAPLRWNWDNGASAEGVNAREVLTGGTYDAVIVTEAIPLADQILWNDTQGYAKRYFDLALGANPDTQFYIYETWHSLGADAAQWRAQIASDISSWESIADHINASLPAGASPALIVPAGQAIGALYDAIEAGLVPGLGSIRDVFDDAIHLNDIGNWFVAAVQAAVVAGVDAATVPLETFAPWGTPFGGPDAAMAAAMDVVIDEVLAAYPRDGVDGGGSTPADPDPSPEETPDPAPEETPVPDVTPDPAPTDPTPTPPVDVIEISGNSGDNLLNGNGADNVIRGRGGDDRLTGGAGNDTLDGGDGWDTAIYDTALAHLTLTLAQDGVTIEDRSGGNGTDTLTQIEALAHNGGTLDLSQLIGAATLTGQQMESLIELYIAYFNRAPDAVGLSFWGTAFADGLSLAEIATLFTDQDETRAMYDASVSDAAFISTVYGNVLGRAGDAEGVAFWSEMLTSGAVARDQFILEVLAGARADLSPDMPADLIAQQNADRLYLSDKTDLGAYFAVHRGLSDLEAAAAVMVAYDGTGAGYDAGIGVSDLAWRAVELGQDDLFVMQTLGVLDTPSWW